MRASCSKALVGFEVMTWPVVYRRLFEFVMRCIEDPTALDHECEDFATFPSAKGFQSGMLSPILSALRPQAFLVVNRKSLRAINHWCHLSLSTRLSEYPSANAAGLRLLSQAGAILSPADSADALPCDMFDCFCHWLWAEKKYWQEDGDGIQYWKISPGRGGELWDDWRSEGYAAIGFSDLGDLAGISREEFNLRQKDASVRNPDWGKAGPVQAWTLREIPRPPDSEPRNLRDTGRRESGRTVLL